MGQCAGIKRDGGKCKASVPPGVQWCFNHDPARAEERKSNAQRAGRARSGGAELTTIKREIRDVIGDVLAGRVDKGVGAVALQGYNTLLRAVEISRRDELEDLATQVEEIKRGFGGAA